MAKLEFTKQGDLYVAEVTVNNDYNVHIEREKGGFLYLEQRSTQEGRFASCGLPSGVSNGYWSTLDYTFAHGFYPMTVRFKSTSPITMAEIQEISKEV